MHVPLSIGLSHTPTPTGRLLTPSASSHQDFSREPWGLLLFCYEAHWMFIQAKALSASGNGDLFGVAESAFLARFVPAPLSMPCPWGEKKANSPGLHSVHQYWKAALLRSIYYLLGRYISCSVCLKEGQLLPGQTQLWLA